MSVAALQMTDIRAWTDVGEATRFRNACPSVIMRAAEIEAGEYDGLLGDDFVAGQEVRKVIYERVSDGEKFYMELVLYEHPVGAGDITILTAPGTSLVAGRCIGEDGAFGGATPVADEIAGVFLSHYCETTSFVGSNVANTPEWATTLSEGDRIWVIRRGRVTLLAETAGINAGSRIVADNGGGTGRFRDAATIGDTSAGDESANILENIPLYGMCVGVAKETAALDAYADSWLNLPPRYTK